MSRRSHSGSGSGDAGAFALFRLATTFARLQPMQCSPRLGLLAMLVGACSSTPISTASTSDASAAVLPDADVVTPTPDASTAADVRQSADAAAIDAGPAPPTCALAPTPQRGTRAI